MATVMKRLVVNKNWTLVTATTALLQFEDRCTMYLGGDTAPTVRDGFIMEKLDKYVNNGLVNVWVKGMHDKGTIVVVCEMTE